MSTIANDIPRLSVGQIKTFGPIGPKYQIRKLLAPIGYGDWLIEILLVETGETTEYRYSRMMNDPEAD